MKLTKAILLALGFNRVIECSEPSFVYYTLPLSDTEGLVAWGSPTGEDRYTIRLRNSSLGKCKTDSEFFILYKALLGKEFYKSEAYLKLLKE